jgi:hypothetical protein
MFYTEFDTMDHILLNLNGYIDRQLNTQLVYDLYLNSMEGHLLMINCEKLPYKVFFFFINKLSQVDTLGEDINVSPH